MIESLIKHNRPQVPSQRFCREYLIVTEHDHEWPHEKQGCGAGQSIEPGVIADAHEHLHVVCEYISLVCRKCHCKQIFGPSRLVSHPVGIDVKWDVPARDA